MYQIDWNEFAYEKEIHEKLNAFKWKTRENVNENCMK